MFSIAKAIAAIFAFLRGVLGWFERAEQRKAGQDDLRADINAKTVDTKDKMDGVDRPSDDAVADSLRTGKF